MEDTTFQMGSTLQGNNLLQEEQIISCKCGALLRGGIKRETSSNASSGGISIDLDTF